MGAFCSVSRNRYLDHLCMSLDCHSRRCSPCCSMAIHRAFRGAWLKLHATGGTYGPLRDQVVCLIKFPELTEHHVTLHEQFDSAAVHARLASPYRLAQRLTHASETRPKDLSCVLGELLSLLVRLPEPDGRSRDNWRSPGSANSR